MSVTSSALASQLAPTSSLAGAYARIRQASLALCDGLAPEDMVLQSMPSASPLKWHLAHTSWFFENFILATDAQHRPLRDGWNFLFNSYYQSVGPMHARAARGLLSRPTVADVLDYRRDVDAAMRERLERGVSVELAALVRLGLEHEQQHQELMLMDLLHLFSLNPLEPAYRPATARTPQPARTPGWHRGREGIVMIGHDGEGFAFDNESPRHRVLLQPHRIANRMVTNGEFREFIRDGGYRRPTLWLSDGWAKACAEAWQHPPYWSDDLDSEFTLAGRVALDPAAPVCPISYFEADAYARWAGARLPTEAEWEDMAARLPDRHGNFVESGALRPLAADIGTSDLPQQMYGDAWEWTSSAYSAYPGYRPDDGAIGEYNGKFMSGQLVLRGGACITPAAHVRASYRNFFYPADRWQFAGFRLGQDA
ncbi:ergothioneine biosynthesis protein EgtB [Solimonas marina]|uniref:Ergothioneine biosynthesis protein EgtB n=1 Tax=Solimonas marina TaxID=2714601 RepID=A0A969WCG4_9GAMM|nr:ergothioneine biosynthesis protein EgtB [Solimonas marina]NKF23478.1 ergothioneine biosynthesis protein EgtB [Solimonas marina]